MSIRILSNELQKKSERELNEVPKIIQEDLKHIRDWIAKQPYLTVKNGVVSLALNQAKEKIDRFYTMRSLLPEIFSNRDPLLPEIQQVLELGLFLPLPKTTEPNGSRIILVRCENVDPSIVPFVHVVKTSIMIIDILMNEDDNFIIAEQLAFLDGRGMTMNHIVQVTPSICKKIVMCLQNAYPTRPKGFHFIEFYKAKDVNKVAKAIPQFVLPKEYGGDGGSLEEITSEWKKKVESYREWFLNDAKYNADETKRIGEPKTSDCVFGIAGSFRKLDID